MSRPVHWTPEMVSRFWDHLAETSLLTRFSFARSAGPALVRLVEPFLRRDADYIDYGGGDGYLCQHLVERGFRCGVYEPSKVGVQNLTERIGSREKFLGAFPIIESERFDGVFCLEVIEHVLEEKMDEFLTDIGRVLKASGIAFITCPNHETLEDSSVVCPVCESYFHRWQHVRSLELAEVVSLISRAGLKAEWSGLVGFEAFESIEHWCQCRDEGRRYIDRNLTALQKIGKFLLGDRKRNDGIDLRIGSENNIVLVARKEAL